MPSTNVLEPQGIYYLPSSEDWNPKFACSSLHGILLVVFVTQKTICRLNITQKRLIKKYKVLQDYIDRDESFRDKITSGILAKA